MRSGGRYRRSALHITPFLMLARMPFDHEELDVYTVALDFVVLANGVVEGLPRGRSHLVVALSKRLESQR